MWTKSLFFLKKILLKSTTFQINCSWVIVMWNTYKYYVTLSTVWNNINKLNKSIWIAKQTLNIISKTTKLNKLLIPVAWTSKIYSFIEWEVIFTEKRGKDKIPYTSIPIKTLTWQTLYYTVFSVLWNIKWRGLDKTNTGVTDDKSLKLPVLDSYLVSRLGPSLSIAGQKQTSTKRWAPLGLKHLLRLTSNRSPRCTAAWMAPKCRQSFMKAIWLVTQPPTRVQSTVYSPQK